jgi:hypothetical protein
MKRIAVFAFLFFASLSSCAFACEFCTLHNGLGQYNVGGDFFSLTERFTSADTFVKGGTQTTNPAGPYSIQINTVQFMYQHAYSDDTRLIFSIPQFDKRSASTISDTSSGLGDATAMVRYKILGDMDQFFAGVLGLKLPTGARKTTPASEGGNGFLNPDLVLGTGSLDELLGFVYNRNLASFAYSVDALYKFAGTGYDGYQYGNVLNLGLGGYYKFHNNWNFGLGFASEIMDADTDTKGTVTSTTGKVDNTGGEVVFFVPTIQYTFQNYYVEVSYQQPVYRNFYGSQGQTVVTDKVVLAFRHAF